MPALTPALPHPEKVKAACFILEKKTGRDLQTDGLVTFASILTQMINKNTLHVLTGDPMYGIYPPDCYQTMNTNYKALR